ncbi:glycoside hydrolase family 16 protein [Nocardioides humilatus]|uniref:Glycoside hydrolase family 16 protein n=1 Tax=Nocardioides humilatus TaxID=2607660 RepID=A0A5B1LKY7_9ACTN|nr:glycoside hydrolase family 16 protein [Nocardioides humilatus]KAA1420798.1 glycoside hydrolase family 16 protein [Nocardioides humilatus]
MSDEPDAPVEARPRRRAVAVAVAVVLVLIVVAALVVLRAEDEEPPPPPAADACGPLLTKPSGETWECTFVDAFDGSALDAEKWITQDTSRTGFKSALTCYRGDDNVAVADGELVLEARDVGAPMNCDNPYGAFRTRYTGGIIGTRTHFSQTYGRFEVRAKFPPASQPGLHGGFWMYPEAMTYGKWPASGEIDVAEWWSNDPTLVLPTLHYNGRNPHADSGWGCRVDDVTEFHTYAAEWFESVIRFLIDGQICFVRRWLPTAPQVAPQPFDKPFSLILNMGVGTATGTNAVSPATPLPAAFTVDYVKAWQ